MELDDRARGVDTSTFTGKRGGRGVARKESRPAQQVLLAHLDTGVLGDCYTEESIVIEAGADHFDLIAPERINRHLAEILAIVS